MCLVFLGSVVMFPIFHKAATKNVIAMRRPQLYLQSLDKTFGSLRNLQNAYLGEGRGVRLRNVQISRTERGLSSKQRSNVYMSLHVCIDVPRIDVGLSDKTQISSAISCEQFVAIFFTHALDAKPDSNYTGEGFVLVFQPSPRYRCNGQK